VLRRHHEEHRLSGVSALIYQGGDVVDDFCVGEADIEQGQAIRPDHIHRANSNTKLITAVLTLMLVDEGRLALDDPINCRGSWLCMAATSPTPTSQDSGDSTNCLGPAPS
jgi:CubicO group peptidase (beta-lactamase class C family)